MSDLSNQSLQGFAARGYHVLPGLADRTTVHQLRDQVMAALREPPMELEADTGYPGAPTDPGAPGGQTPRRLLQARARGGALASWSSDARVVAPLQRLLDSSAVYLTQSHHNCVMTKYPGYSSDTLWHQDIRYWSFRPPRLINCWLALGEEYPENGGLQVIAGSHRWPDSASRVDEAQFLLPDLPANAEAIAGASAIRLKPGDLLMFDAALFHSASRNNTDQIKLSVVFSYHGSDVIPAPGSRSASQPEVRVDLE